MTTLFTGWKFSVRWREPGGLPECPYFYRWVFDFGKFAIRVHKWLADDDLRAYHDHPYWFLTLVVWGGYDDVTPGAFGDGSVSRDTLRAGSLRYRPAFHRHCVELTHRPTWTLLLTGRPTRRWSFYRPNGQVLKRDKYFAEYGHHPCSHEQEPVRVRPDGTRIPKGHESPVRPPRARQVEGRPRHDGRDVPVERNRV